jgi:hypothetical protein
MISLAVSVDPESIGAGIERCAELSHNKDIPLDVTLVADLSRSCPSSDSLHAIEPSVFR